MLAFFYTERLFALSALCLCPFTVVFLVVKDGPRLLRGPCSMEIDPKLSFCMAMTSSFLAWGVAVLLVGCLTPLAAGQTGDAIRFGPSWDSLDEGLPNSGVIVGRFETTGNQRDNCTQCTNTFFDSSAGGVCFKNIVDTAPFTPAPQPTGDNAVLPYRDITVEVRHFSLFNFTFSCIYLEILPSWPFLQAWVLLSDSSGEIFQSTFVSCMRGHFPFHSQESYDYGFNLGFTEGHLYFGVSTSLTSNAMNTPVMFGPPIYSFNPDRWYHVAGTYDGTYRRLYALSPFSN